MLKDKNYKFGIYAAFMQLYPIILFILDAFNIHPSDSNILLSLLFKTSVISFYGSVAIAILGIAFDKKKRVAIICTCVFVAIFIIDFFYSNGNSMLLYFLMLSIKCPLTNSYCGE